MEKKQYLWKDPVKGNRTIFDCIQPRLYRTSIFIKSNTLNLRQSYVAIFLSILTDIFAGFFLGNSQELLRMLPGIVVLVPAALGMRGQIFASLGSRLGSALHMGTLKKFDQKNPVMRNNIYASLALTIIFSVLLGFLARFVLLLFGMPSISVADLIFISFIGGILSGIILLLITIGITLISFMRGWDPDNVTSPMITALGDFFTVPCLMIAAIAMTKISILPDESILIVFGGLAILVFLDIFMVESKRESTMLKESSYRKIVLQSSFVILFMLLLDSIAGVLIESNLSSLVAIPILIVLLPAFLEEGGNIGNIMASRLATRLHMGSVKAKLKISGKVKMEFINSYILSFLIFFSVAIMTFVFSILTGIGGLSLYQLLEITLAAGFILSTIVIIITFVVSIISFKYNIDPDNSSIPIITTVADVVGVFCLLLVLHFMAII